MKWKLILTEKVREELKPKLKSGFSNTKQMKNKLAQVIMLPTEDKTSVVFSGFGNLFHTPPMSVKTSDIFQHLYFTTDEEIKDDDYYLCPKNILRRCKNSFIIGGRKVVATTDKLEISKYQPQFTVDKTPITKYLPQPPQAFIEKYCKEGGIDEVMIEYIEYEQFDGSLLPGHTYSKELKLKVDSDNTITITPAKDSWDQEELVTEIFRALYNYKALCTEYPDGTVKAVDKEKLEKLLSNPDINLL